MRLRNALPVWFTMPLVVVGAFCRLPDRTDPVDALTAGLARYFAYATHEPIDDPANIRRMETAVAEIRARRMVAGIEALLNVALFYDATDNEANWAARETLIEFGQRALPAIRARIAQYRGGRFDDRVSDLKWLERQIAARAGTEP